MNADAIAAANLRDTERLRDAQQRGVPSGVQGSVVAERSRRYIEERYELAWAVSYLETLDQIIAMVEARQHRGPAMRALVASQNFPY